MPVQFGNLTLFGVEEIAKKFSLNPVTVRRLFKTGKLRGRKIGKRWYLTEEALREYFEGSRTSEKGKA
jgi:excisionase family DNA binding protein